MERGLSASCSWVVATSENDCCIYNQHWKMWGVVIATPKINFGRMWIRKYVIFNWSRLNSNVIGLGSIQSRKLIYTENQPFARISMMSSTCVNPATLARAPWNSQIRNGDLHIPGRRSCRWIAMPWIDLRAIRIFNIQYGSWSWEGQPGKKHI